MTEGNDEKAFLDLLLERGLLKFSKEELFYDDIFHLRQLKGDIIIKLRTLGHEDTVDIYRVGDKLSDVLRIPNEIKKLPIKRINKIEDVLISPEFEILMIIHENKYNNFLKEKSKTKASDYYKKLHNEYDKSSKYVMDYFSKLSNDQIIDLIKDYLQKRRSICINKGKKTLDYLLKI